MLTTLQACILGVLEGLTEFLPISSTGHLILLSKFLHIPDSDALSLFKIVVQFGAILAVVAYMGKRFLSIELLKRLMFAVLPTAILGKLLYPQIKEMLQSELLVGAMLLLGGILIIAIEMHMKTKPQTFLLRADNLPYFTCFLLGLAQSLAMVPGVSRSGAIIMAGLVMGVSRVAIVEFSFLLAVPTMLLAATYSMYKNLYLIDQVEVMYPIILGTAVAFMVALAVIHFFLNYIKRAPFAIFGYYRIIIGVCVLYMFM